MHPERFGGRGHQLGVLPLMTLPGVLCCRRLRGLGTLMSLAVVYFVVWWALRQNVRFLFPVIPLVGVAALWVWVEIRRFRQPARLAAGATFAAVIAAMAVVSTARSYDTWTVALGIRDREDYLVAREPTYPAAAVANALMDDRDHLLTQDYRAFYFDCRVTRESIYRRYTTYDRNVSEPSELGRQLRARGFTHLLLAERVAGEGIDYDPVLSRLVDAQLAARTADDLTMLTDYLFRDSDGAVRRYRLIALR
jgi:hypothetical protein